jgi:hypothetical protein
MTQSISDAAIAITGASTVALTFLFLATTLHGETSCHQHGGLVVYLLLCPDENAIVTVFSLD